MGLFSGGGFFGKIGEALNINTTRLEGAARRAGDLESEALDKAMEQIKSSLGISTDFIQKGSAQATGSLEQGVQQGVESLDPFRTAGVDALGKISQFGTVGALQETLGGLGGFLDPLIEQRQRASSFALAGAGLSRSGRAAEEAADIDFSTRLGLAQQLQSQQFQAQSQLAGLGVNAATNIGNFQVQGGRDLANVQTGEARDLSRLETGAGVNISNLLTDQGASQAATEIGVANIKQSGKLAAGNLVKEGVGAFVGAGGIPGISESLQGLLKAGV